METPSKDAKALTKIDSGIPDLVSVVIPCYNGARFLAEAIDSISTQTYKQIEIIVVDDGSTDNSSEIAASYPQVKCIRQENQGIAGARNRGLQESKGSYLIFHDHDDRLLPHAVETHLNYLNTYPDCGFVFGYSLWLSGNEVSKPYSYKPKPFGETDYYLEILKGDIVRILAPPSVGMFRRIVFQSMGGFDLDFNPVDDYEMYLRVARTFPVYCHNQAVVEYRRHGSNHSTNPARMYHATTNALDAQWKYIVGNKEYEEAIISGKRYWQNIWARGLPRQILTQIRSGQWKAAGSNVGLLLHHPEVFIWWSKRLVTLLNQSLKKK